MRLEHEFSVPAPPEVVWAAVIDPERVAPCMPGATLTSVDGSSFAGGVKVKLGPVSLLYKGTGEFLETDEQARRVVIKASGKDSRGNGTAAATVTVTLTPDGDGTKGSVSTDLTVTGKPAQFGRGMIVEVGGKILDTFAGCLASKLGEPSAPAEAPAPVAAPAVSAATRSAADGPVDAADEEDEPALTSPKPTRRRTAAKTPAPSATGEPIDGVAREGVAQDRAAQDGAHLQLVGDLGEPAPAEAAPTAPPAPKAPPTPAAESRPEVEAIDLLDYAGPSIAKRAAPVAAVVVVLLIVWRLVRRRR